VHEKDGVAAQCPSLSQQHPESAVLCFYLPHNPAESDRGLVQVLSYHILVNNDSHCCLDILSSCTFYFLYGYDDLDRVGSDLDGHGDFTCTGFN
jgi:hypothetical protein